MFDFHLNTIQQIKKIFRSPAFFHPRLALVFFFARPLSSVNMDSISQTQISHLRTNSAYNHSHLRHRKAEPVRRGKMDTSTDDDGDDGGVDDDDDDDDVGDEDSEHVGG